MFLFKNFSKNSSNTRTLLYTAAAASKLVHLLKHIKGTFEEFQFTNIEIKSDTPFEDTTTDHLCAAYSDLKKGRAFLFKYC